MKRLLIFSCCFFTLIGFVKAQNFAIKGNPIITDKFTADPAAMVYNGTVYLYVGQR